MERVMWAIIDVALALAEFTFIAAVLGVVMISVFGLPLDDADFLAGTARNGLFVAYAVRRIADK